MVQKIIFLKTCFFNELLIEPSHPSSWHTRKLFYYKKNSNDSPQNHNFHLFGPWWKCINMVRRSPSIFLPATKNYQYIIDTTTPPITRACLYMLLNVEIYRYSPKNTFFSFLGLENNGNAMVSFSPPHFFCRN